MRWLVLALFLALSSPALGQFGYVPNYLTVHVAAGPAYVTSWDNSCSAATTTCTISSITTTNGDMIACIASASDASSFTVSFAAGSNTFTAQDPEYYSTFSYGGEQGYVLSITGAPTSITATFSASVTFAEVFCAEYSGVVALDQHVGNLQTWAGTTGNAVTSTAKTTTSNGELIFGGVVDIGSYGLTAGSGFLQRLNLSSTFLLEDKVQATAGSIAATATGTGSAGSPDATLAWMMTFTP